MRRHWIACCCLVAWAALGASLGAPLPAMADAPGWLAPWFGTYVFDGTAGHTVGGSPIVYHDTLTVRRTSSGPACALHLEGYQEDETLRCTVHGDRDVLQVAFASFADGSLANVYGVRVYQPGAVLFRLTRAGGGTNPAIATAWLALHPDGVAQTGVFFRRNGS